ncbi:MAG: N-acetylmuramoyl-L-alanine amidase, partial [Verrucomicrobia bacterium]|nr:N-acetylmuramoyl-L-alanine amidase [Verrucomicrobiota bacterium]
CAPTADAVKPLPPRFWRPRSAVPPSPDAAAQPLAGLVIGLDPGHLGGRWAQPEERWFRLDAKTKPVTEGDMTLRVARLLAERLRALGAKVVLVRDGTEPQALTPSQPPRPPRPADFRDLARAVLAARGIADPPLTYADTADANRLNTVQWESLHLLLRADIFARARRVNTALHPDLVLCLHFNAEPWGDPKKPALVDKNHFHLLIHGCYGPDELADDDTRFALLLKLLNGSHAAELAAASPLANAVARATGLPPYEYPGRNAIRVGPNPYVWARNLLANRLYRCPVLYLEPYVMNSPDVFDRVQAGDYAGEREVHGLRHPSIYREYADAVAAGLAEYYRAR